MRVVKVQVEVETANVAFIGARKCLNILQIDSTQSPKGSIRYVEYEGVDGWTWMNPDWVRMKR